jgi:hypothetical protein
MIATELRIGNLVYNRHNEIYIVNENTFQDFRYPKMDGNYGYSGIPLTEEWLLKAGFKTRVTINHSVQYFKGENPITNDWLFDILWLEGYSEPFYRNGFHKIKYVHQLQNLYFVLTCEELEVK